MPQEIHIDRPTFKEAPVLVLPDPGGATRLAVSPYADLITVRQNRDLVVWSLRDAQAIRDWLNQVLPEPPRPPIVDGHTPGTGSPLTRGCIACHQAIGHRHLSDCAVVRGEWRAPGPLASD